LSKALKDASASQTKEKAKKPPNKSLLKHPPSTEAPPHLQSLYDSTTKAQSSAQKHADKALAAAAQARIAAADARAAAAKARKADKQNSQSRQNTQEKNNEPWKSLMNFFKI